MNQGFFWSGCGTANTEAEGIKISSWMLVYMPCSVPQAWHQKAGSYCRQWTLAWENWVWLKLNKPLTAS